MPRFRNNHQPHGPGYGNGFARIGNMAGPHDFHRWFNANMRVATSAPVSER